MVLIASGLYGCSSPFKLQIYNNTGKDVKATWDDTSASARPGGVLRLAVKNFDPDKFFQLQIGTEIVEYRRLHGIIGCWEFPASGGCNVWQLQPDRTIWYLGGSEPTLKPPYPPPTIDQPAGFPLQPMVARSVNSLLHNSKDAQISARRNEYLVTGNWRRKGDGSGTGVIERRLISHLQK
jgi:hypothetical protein